MASRRLKHWLKAYLQYTSYNESPDIFHFWTGIGTLAGALRRKVYIDQEYFQWTPNFYIIFVAPSGVVSKSTTIHIGLSLLREISDIHFGPNAITWQALVSALAASTQGIQMDDGSIYPMSCLTFGSSEFGTLLDPRDRAMVDLLVDLWDGQQGVWRKMTKSAGDDAIANPWLNILACTTPTWMAENIPKSMIGGGFTSRCVFVYADKKRQLVAYPKLAVPQNINKLKEDLIHDLEAISILKGEFELTADAIEYGIEWYKNLHDNPPLELIQSGFDGYLARKQGHIHKVAMVLSASQRDNLVIEKNDLEAASILADELEQYMPLVFKAIRTTPVMENAERIVDMVKSHKSLTRTALYRQFFHIMPVREFNEALDSAVHAGILQIEQRGSTIYIKSVEH